MEISIESDLLLLNAEGRCFINGTAYAGKSTMVRMLAEKYSGICRGGNYRACLGQVNSEEKATGLSASDSLCW